MFLIIIVCLEWKIDVYWYVKVLGILWLWGSKVFDFNDFDNWCYVNVVKGYNGVIYKIKFVF